MSDTAQETTTETETVVGGEEVKADEAPDTVLTSEPAVDTSTADPYESFELKLPEDSKVSQERASTIIADAKEQGLPPSAAEALIKNEDAVLKGVEVAQKKLVLDQRKEWVESLKKDPTWGGEKWNETVQLAKRGLEAHGDEEMKKFLGVTGLGDNPSVIKLFARLGKMAADDKLVRDGVKVRATERSYADILYGDSSKG